MKKYNSILLKILAVLSIPLSFFGLPDFQFLIDLPSVIMVILPVLVSALCFYLGWGQSWARTFLVLGLPVGLLATTVGMVQITISLSDLDLAGPAMAICLVTLIYGGIVSAVGFAALESDIQNQSLKSSPLLWVIPLITTFGVMLWGAYSGGYFAILDFIRVDVAFVTIASLFVFMSFRKKVPTVVRWTEGSLFASIISVSVAVVRWFGEVEYASEHSQFDPIHFANIGLLYGAILYLGGYFISFHTRSSHHVEAERMNWHFLEVNAFLYFITIAPSSIPDTLLLRQSKLELSEFQESVEQR
jgi:hypothetical protein